ncbi:MAG: SDR family NAD(P)-dependent oxidoreductase [Deltaproteobacteria bacterium]|nr:SDR family NAD(P)-dependent oxidoreductase [Nannocystaceae bacterium]
MPGHDLRTAFVTGASSGIGAALARLLARQGLTVAIAARREHDLRVLATEIEASGGRALVVPVDVSDPAAITLAVQDADRELGGLDLVIANAGVAKQRSSAKIDWNDCADMLGVNVIGATATLVAAIPAMVARGRGHLVGVSSISAFRGLPKLAVYSASKAYLSAMLEAMRVDLAPKGITVTDVRPGYVRTAMNEGADKLPMELTADAAAQEIFDAIAAGKAMHAFPFVVATAMRTMASLPIGLWDKLAAKLT